MRNFIRAARLAIKGLHRKYSAYFQLCYTRLIWTITSEYDDVFRYATVTFKKGEETHSMDISEAEYLYDLDAAILRAYNEYILPNHRVRKRIGGRKSRKKRNQAARRQWNLAKKYTNLK